MITVQCLDGVQYNSYGNHVEIPRERNLLGET